MFEKQGIEDVRLGLAELFGLGHFADDAARASDDIVPQGFLLKTVLSFDVPDFLHAKCR